MRAFNKIILFGIVLAPLIFTSIAFPCFTDTFAYFSDVEYSTENTITAGTWSNESSFLVISDSILTGNDEKLHGISLEVSGAQNVTIDKIQVWWNTFQNDTGHVTEIMLDGNEFFSGRKSVGEIIDGNNYLLETGSSAKLNLFFDSDISDLSPFTINIITKDGSVKSFVTNPEYHLAFPQTIVNENSDVNFNVGTGV